MASESEIPLTVPILPIRNAVLFPSVSLPLLVGRARSIRALEHADRGDKLIVVIAQKEQTATDPTAADLYEYGTLCRIEASGGSESGSMQIVVTGIARYRPLEVSEHPENFLQCRGEVVPDVHGADLIRSEALFYNLKELAREVLGLVPGGAEPLVRLVDSIEDAAYLSNVCAAYLSLPIAQKQELLETVQVERRVEVLLSAMRKEREVLSLQKEIRGKLSERMNKAQRDALLREQIRAIRSELGEEEDEQSVEELELKLRRASLPQGAQRQAEEELRRLRALPSIAAEHHVIRTYLEWIANLPWNQRTGGPIDIEKARKILDEDHFGLKKVKRRILQFLAVAKLKNDIRGPILCLVGPPGVGKTSLGQSIANALDRKFIRTSLGGVRDEAEIRGHRRTYVGAMPGRIIQSLKRAGTRNPVMMLDEIDKLRADFHGDPSSAMLEVLDPEQNCAFTDHYLDVPFDLSEIFFIATANIIDPIPPALKDRLEVIEISGYTTEEKVQIARRHLIPKQLREHGLQADTIELDDATVREIVENYTREAGVRELERQIASLLRAAAEEMVSHEQPEAAPRKRIALGRERLPALLGPRRHYPESVESGLRPGVALGMAWTPLGGELLYVEAAAVSPGRGQLSLTGQLGDVMKESAQIALSLARAAAATAHYRDFDFRENDIHIHLPSGAIAKDGPSAGVTLLTALTSLLTGKPVPHDLAMTGEITLRGALLPVGGIKEKALAAHRAGIRRVLLPRKNEPDLDEIPTEVRNSLQFLFADSVQEALRYALGLKAVAGRAA